MAGLIFSSIGSGQLVSRTGRYKPVLLIGIATLIVGMGLLTQLRVGVDDWTLAAWMFVAGLGVGPTFAVFTIVVQNAVDFRDLGAATSDLTLFRQIGTTVGIAVAFTLFRLNFTWDLLKEQLTAAGVPAAFVPATAPPGFDPAALTNVSNQGSFDFLKLIPEQIQPLFIDGFHRALTISIGNSIWLGVAASAVALLAAFFLREIPLRSTHAPSRGKPAGQPARAGAPQAVAGID
jgi:MFS family permease